MACSSGSRSGQAEVTYGCYGYRWAPQYNVLLERLGDGRCRHLVSAHVGDRHEQSREVVKKCLPRMEEKKKRSRRVAVIKYCCCCWRGAAVFQRWAVIGVKGARSHGPAFWSLLTHQVFNHYQPPTITLHAAPRCSNTFDTPNSRRITHKNPHNTSAPFASAQTPTWPKRSPPSSWSSSVTAVPER
jgi:hypothetical protein